MKGLLSALIILLLAGILVVLTLILQRMPPTLGDFKASKEAAARHALRLKQPMITIETPIDVNVQSGAVEVEPGSTPIPVTIER